MTPARQGDRPTSHEIEILVAFCEGQGIKGAAERLGLSRHTVRGSLANLRSKLGVTTSAAAVYVLRDRL
jgi:DNA-binding NarL/FixJ family response regulator